MFATALRLLDKSIRWIARSLRIEQVSLLVRTERECMTQLVHEDGHEDDRHPRNEQPALTRSVAEQDGKQPERPVDAHGDTTDVDVGPFVRHGR